MKRRQLLYSVGTLGVAVLAGCSGVSSNGQEKRLGSKDQSCNGTEVDFRSSSPKDVRQGYDIPVPIILSGDEVDTAYFESTDPVQVRESGEELGLDISQAASVEWNGEPICDIRSKIRLPDNSSTEDIDAAFPEAVDRGIFASPDGKQFWVIYSRYNSNEEINQVLKDLSIEKSSTSIIIYNDCINYM